MFRQKYNIALNEHHFDVKMAYLETIKAPDNAEPLAKLVSLLF